MATASEELTEEIIDSLKNFGMAYPWMEKYSIPVDEVQDVFTAKLMLKRHLQLTKNPGASAKNARSVVVRLKEEHDKNKQMLQQFYQDTTEHLPHVLKHLEQDNVTSNFQQTIGEVMETLQASKCPILVAGETSSGKSSLLNLLLGEELLPTSTLSTTSVICELRYGQERTAKVFPWEGEPIEVPLSDSDDDKSSLQKLSAYVHQKGKRDEEDFPYKKAEIYLPVDFLKDGITLVDSPGIGESDKMDEVVYEYLQEAFAFIYVINSANAGGIQGGRLGRLLTVVASKNQEQPAARLQKGVVVREFSPHAAIFVCNKWDQVPTEEKEAVQKEQLRVLKRYWPDCTEDQVFQLSALTAAKALHHEVIMEDFLQLLEGIEKLIPTSLQEKLHVHYCWLEQFLSRILFIARALETNAADEQLKEERLREAEKKISHAKSTGSKVVEDMKQKLKDRTEEGVRELGKLLDDPKTEENVTSWSLAEVPTGASLYEVDRMVEGEVSLRLEKVIMDWEEERGIFKKTISELKETFSSALVEIENAIERVQQNLTDDSTEDKKSDGIDRARNVLANLGAVAAEKVFQETRTSLLWMYLKSGALWWMNIYAPMDITHMMQSFGITGKNTEEKYAVGSVAYIYLQSRSKMVLEKFKERDQLRKYVSSKMAPASRIIESFERTINDTIESNRKIVQQLRHDDRSSEEVQKALSHFRDTFSRIYEELCTFGDRLHMTD